MSIRIGSAIAGVIAVVFAVSGGLAWADAGHGDESKAKPATATSESIEEMREAHQAHEHAHDFAAMEHMSQAELARMMAFITDVGIALPPMNSERGRQLFLDKGCIACHAVNGVGGEIGPALDAAALPQPMNAFEFAARMWRGASAMIAMQQDEQFGGQIELTGQDIADLVAFAHDENEQAELTTDQIPEKFKSMIDQ